MGFGETNAAKPQAETRGTPANRGRLMLVALVGSVLLNSPGCQIHKPLVRLNDVEITGLDFRMLEAVFVFEVVNLNSYQVKLRAMEYDVVAGGEKIAVGAISSPLDLPAQQETLVRAPVCIEYERLMPVLKRLRLEDRCPYELRGRSTFEVMGLPLGSSFQHKGEIGAPRAPKWLVKTVRLGGEGGLVLEVVFDVTNPNSFDVPLVGVSGSLKLGDERIVQLERCPTTALAAGKTTEVVFPVRVLPHKAAAAAKAIAAGERFRFDGELRVSPPASVRKLLLGKKD